MSVPEITPVEEPKDLGFGPVSSAEQTKSGYSIATGVSIPAATGCRSSLAELLSLFPHDQLAEVFRDRSGRLHGREHGVRGCCIWRAGPIRYPAQSRRAWVVPFGARSFSRRDDRYGRLRQHRAEQFSGAHRHDGRVAGRAVHVRAGHGNLVLSLLPSHRGLDVQHPRPSSRHIGVVRRSCFA